MAVIKGFCKPRIKVMDDAVEFDLHPRFPLFGGWKTHYTIGYKVPSYGYLFFKGDDRVLNMRLVDHIFDDMLIESASVKVILPEGCTDQDLATIPVSCEGDSKHYINLDTIGRRVWRIAVPSHQRCFWSLFCWCLPSSCSSC